MIAPALLDRDAIARACERYGVARLRVFGSALTDRFDPERTVRNPYFAKAVFDSAQDVYAA